MTVFTAIATVAVIATVIGFSDGEPHIFAGLSNQIEPLSAEESQEILDTCGYGKTAPGNRIIDGEIVNATVPYVAAVIEVEEQSCGATFISWRHLLTAAHCVAVNGKSAPRIRIRAGGICPVQSEECEKDTVVFVFDFIMLDDSSDAFHSAVFRDFALIQLREPVSAHLRKRISFACIPRRDAKLPKELTVYGWGYTAVNSTVKQRLLKKINLIPANVSENRDCLYESTLCLRSKERGGIDDGSVLHHSIYHGDSGGGAFDSAGGRNPVIFGIVSGFYDFIQVSTYVYLRAYIDDICLLLHLCVPGAWARRRNFHPISVYYMDTAQIHRLRRGDFHLMSMDEAAELEKRCTKPLPPSREVAGWAAAVVDGSGRILCSATFLTRRHLITARSCFQDTLLTALPRDLRKPVRRQVRVAAGGTCLPRPNTTRGGCDPRHTASLFDVDFAVWSGEEQANPRADFAFIELRKPVPDSETRIFPICIDFTVENVFLADQLVPRYAYVWQPKEVGAEDEVSHELVEIKTRLNGSLTHERRTHYVLDVPADAPAASVRHVGAAFVTPDTSHFFGTLLATHDGVYTALPTGHLRDMLCAYLNRCSLKFVDSTVMNYEPLAMHGMQPLSVEFRSPANETDNN